VSPAAAKPETPKKGLTKGQVVLLALLFCTLLGSIGWRAFAHSKRAPAGDVPAGATGLVEGGGQDASAPSPEGPEGPEGIERALPYVTEGSFFGLIGFALGYASRKFVKLGLILLALFFVGLQALVWTGTVSVDWQGVIGKLNALIFNLKENETATQFLTRRVPSAGGLIVGYLFGFRRG
jgi:uncharacterized membrane protein (Fun14 family)